MDPFEAFAEILRPLPEPTLLVTLGGVIRAANPACASVFAVDAIHGRSLFSLVVSPDEDLREYLKLCSRNRDFLLGTLTVRDAAGLEVPYRCEGALIDASRGGDDALLLVRLRRRSETAQRFLHLNTEIEQLQVEIRRRHAVEEALRAANRLKDEFLATVSHELRTPLNAILGWARMLRGGHLTAGRAARALETIERNAQMQALLIEDLLDVSRITTGSLRLHPVVVDFRTIIDRAVDAVRPAAENKAIPLNVQLGDAAIEVQGDPHRLQQVVWNLLTNAVKFTPPGGRVDVHLERVDSAARLTVIDTGQGFSPEMQEQLFQPFRQADASTTRLHGGLGLGLAISRQLVEAHGGTVEGRSPGPGEGAVFRIVLPLAARDARASPPAPPAAVEHSPGRLQDLHVLVVDDEADAAELLSAILEEAGATVTRAPSAAEALKVIEAASPDVLLADIGMPEQDGYALIRAVRRHEARTGRHIPAVAVTAYASLRDREEAVRAGFDGHIPKPVDPEQILDSVGTLGRRYDAFDGRSRPVSPD